MKIDWLCVSTYRRIDWRQNRRPTGGSIRHVSLCIDRSGWNQTNQTCNVKNTEYKCKKGLHKFKHQVKWKMVAYNGVISIVDFQGFNVSDPDTCVNRNNSNSRFLSNTKLKDLL